MTAPRRKPTGPQWVKSSFSFSNGNCIEVANLGDGTIGVRDSKDPDGPVLVFPASALRAFTRGQQQELQPSGQRGQRGSCRVNAKPGS